MLQLKIISNLYGLYKKIGSGAEFFEDFYRFKSCSCMIVGIEQ